MQSLYHVEKPIVAMHKDQSAQSAATTRFCGACIYSISRTATSSQSRHADVMQRYAAPAAARPPAAAPVLSDDEVSEDNDISVLQARDDEVMRATMHYCVVEDDAELVREIIESVSSDPG